MGLGTVDLNFYRDFTEALSLTDYLLLLDIYPSREKPIDNVTSQLIYDEMADKGYSNIFLNHNPSLIPETINKIYKDGDIIITMGGGDVNKQNGIIFEALC